MISQRRRPVTEQTLKIKRQRAARLAKLPPVRRIHKTRTGEEVCASIEGPQNATEERLAAEFIRQVCEAYQAGWDALETCRRATGITRLELETNGGVVIPTMREFGR